MRPHQLSVGAEVCRWSDSSRSKPVDRPMLAVSGPAITAVLASDGSSEIVRIYNAAERNGVDLDPTFIGRDFACKHEKPFNQASMGLPSHYGKARCRTVPG
jgi:hypothetical protein